MIQAADPDSSDPEVELSDEEKLWPQDQKGMKSMEKKELAPVMRLNSGYDLPVVGLGTYALHGKTCTDAVISAVRSGYRLIDTASFYGNEREVGEGVRRSGIAREAIFVQTKLYPDQYDHAARAIDEALEKLDIGYNAPASSGRK